jgi:peptidoglycan/LPS O-acetylase OafA/YrhL
VLCLANAIDLPAYSLSNSSAVTSRGVAYISPFIRILEFVFGMAVANLCLRWRERNIVASLPVWLWTSFEVCALAVTIFSSWYCRRFDFDNQNAFTVYVSSCGSFPAFGLLIGILSFERGLVSRFLSMGWLVLLGEISYSIYLVHQIIIRFCSQDLPIFASIPKMLLYLAYWFAVLSLSFIIWRWVEKPCQRWIRSLFGSKRDDAKAIAVSAPVITNP